MANKNLFKGVGAGRGVVVPPPNTLNVAGAPAYSMDNQHALAQLAVTGMLGDAFYTSAAEQLEEVLTKAQLVAPEFLAKLAIYSRESGKMKDMPALICAVLFGMGEDVLLKKIFLRVIDNGRMLRNFVQMIRSGKVGRKSLGTVGKKLVQSYFDVKSPESLFRDSVGNDPSLADVIKLAHPRPTDATRQALYRYIIGKELNDEQLRSLPRLVQEFEHFKTVRNNPASEARIDVVPDVPFQMLTALPLSTDDWKQIAKNGNWHFVRMNLNTFERHGVLKDREIVKLLAEKLADAQSVQKAKVFPYQLLIAYVNTDNNIPDAIRNALQDALEVSTENIPKFEVDGIQVYSDVSGSMGGSVSGYREGATSKVTYNDVAALFAACVLRKNAGNTEVVPFDTGVYKARLNGKDSIMANAKKLREYGGGGTDCSAALRDANTRGVKADLVVYVSDNASWCDAKSDWTGTGTMKEWRAYKKRNPNAKMVNINIAPYTATVASNDKDILNIGGFSDTIFETINNFVHTKAGDQWTATIEAIKLDA